MRGEKNIMIQMITYEYKLYSSRRNKKLNKMIDLSAIVWNHCIALHIFFKQNINEIKRLCKNLSKKQKNSNNYQRAKIALARLYKRITNLRKDFHYKTAYDICSKYTIICI